MMATLIEMAERLVVANPKNTPMCLGFMAEQFWPDADWLQLKCRNAGARRGAMAAAGVAGRLLKRNLLRRSLGTDKRSLWVWVAPNAKLTGRDTGELKSKSVASERSG